MNTSSSRFAQMPISEGMKQTLKDMGFEQPMPIQEQSIPELLSGRDLLGQAQTGTGKTAAFGVPLIEMINEKSPVIQGLVMCPTRELCLQVCEEIRRLSAFKPNLGIEAIYGGQGIDRQFKALRVNKPQIIVATPGRLFDHLRRESIELSKVVMIVLDEADEMLDMGFRPEIEQIFGLLPEENQRIFFSATMPKAIKDLAVTYLRNPAIIKTESKSLTATKIDQSYFRVRARDKTEVLCRVLEHRDPKLAVVFCNAKSTVDEIVGEIKFRGFEAGELHGDLSQNQRDRVMQKFKAGQIRVLVATDVAARGIDIEDIELVINYHLPQDPEDYVHRIGRTGRAGRSGRAISLVEPRDNSRLRRIAQIARADIKEVDPPTLNDVKDAKIVSIFDKVRKAIAGNAVAEYRNIVAKEGLSHEDIAAGMVHMALEKMTKLSQEIDSSEPRHDRSFSANKKFERPFEKDRNQRGGFRKFGGQGNFGGPRREFSDNNFGGPRRESSFGGPRREFSDSKFGGPKREYSEGKTREGGFGGDRARPSNRNEGGDFRPREHSSQPAYAARPRNEGPGGGFRGPSDRPAFRKEHDRKDFSKPRFQDSRGPAKSSSYAPREGGPRGGAQAPSANRGAPKRFVKEGPGAGARPFNKPKGAPKAHRGK
jgi:ATP-dependent RNA helicase DeaD